MDQNRGGSGFDGTTRGHVADAFLGGEEHKALLSPQVKNTVGYDTLGHCFFLEDGIEQRNTFYHNLGLLTRPGTLLPTDRNESLCTSIRDKVYEGYTPSPSTECKAVSTFWIAHPNNNLISNAAAGSQVRATDPLATDLQDFTWSSMFSSQSQ
ncbi:Cell surface hyaluronidase [Takifugu flavidus]|uniref:Cell surface hyaluronidase n=1 Tax=Takifugu flavidus TaxID=433684 RepID=A0A5C6MXB2_9TELE|nr:Cell surface hyaluronidase [Takifugu flavidus]